VPSALQRQFGLGAAIIYNISTSSIGRRGMKGALSLVRCSAVAGAQSKSAACRGSYNEEFI